MTRLQWITTAAAVIIFVTLAAALRAVRHITHSRTPTGASAMNADQYHLCKIAEECTEVGQRALKAMQFGLGEIQKGQDFDNLERLMDEFHDLFTTFENFTNLVERPHTKRNCEGHQAAQNG